MNKTFVMLSGIPRSGSSVLQSMLNQHPSIYASTTSPIIDMIEVLNNNWFNISNALVERYPMQYPNMLAGLMDGAYKHIDKPVIIDKNRIWPRYGELLTDILGQRPKIICTVRDIVEVMASYIILINKNPDKITFIDQDLIDSNLPVNNKNRCKLLLEKYINQPYTSLKIGYKSNYADLLIVDYDQIVNNSQDTIDRICDFIGIERIVVDLNNLQPMDENDAFHGGIDGLHTVRSVMKRTSPPANEIIGHELVKYYSNMKLEFWK